MPSDWGTKHNGVRLGVFWDGIEVSADGSQARITNARIKIDRDVNISDSSNNLSWSGGAVGDGSDANINVDGSGEKTIKNCSETWCDLSYSGTISREFNASMSGINYAGATISTSANITYPQRQYDLPAVPTGINWTGSLGNFTVTWPNSSTETAPWSTLDLYRVDYNTGVETVISVSNPMTATSMVQTVDPTSRYYWYLVAGNARGNTSASIIISPVTPTPLHTLTMDYNTRIIDQTVNFTINNNGSTYKSAIYVDGILIQSPTIATTKAYTFTQATWATRMSSITSKSLVVILETWTADGVTLIGSLSYSLTLNLPTPLGVYAPTANAPTVAEQTTAISTAFGTGTYIQNQSVVRITHSGAPGVGATITKKEVIVNGVVYDVTITGYKDIPVTWTTSPTAQSRTTDTRTVSDLSSTVVIKGYSYAKPAITNFIAQRVDGSGNPTGSGTQIKFTVDVTATSINNGGEKNNMKFDVYLAVGGVKSGPALFSKPLTSQLTTVAPYQVSGVIGVGDPTNTYSKYTSYSFILEANDDLPTSTVTRLSSIPTEIVPLSIGPNGVAVGKVYDNTAYAVDVVGNTKLKGNLEVTGAITLSNPDSFSLPGRLGLKAKPITDWDNAVDNGWYMASDATNAPATGWFIGEVISNNTMWITQELYAFSSNSAADTKTWRRQSYDSSGLVWGAWYRIRKSEAELDARYSLLSHAHQGDEVALNASAIQTETDSWDTILTQGLHPNLVLGNQPQGPTPGFGLYFYVQTYTYGGSSGNRTQVAIPYTNANSTASYIRSRYAGVWTVWSTLGEQHVRAKMTKSTVGHNAAGSAYSASTWTKISGFNITNYAENFPGIDITNGRFVINYTGNYDILFQCRWQNYGSANSRSFAIVKGGSAPAADASNVLTMTNIETSAWLIQQVPAMDVPLLDTDYITFWIRSSTSSTMNTANTAIPGWTFASITKR